jgi:ABC-2 type transport system permease protein
MIRSFKAELVKLRRRRVAMVATAGALAFAVIASTAVFLSATQTEAPGDRGTTIASLSEAGGATEAFAIGVSFTGLVVLVLFIANFAGEFSQGTIRTLLMRQPHRLGLLAGKMAALLTFVAGVLIVAEIFTVAASATVAPSQDVATGSWFGVDALGHAAGDYATALLGVVSWALFGMAIAVFVRSIPVALGIGIVWAGPFEHILQDSWTSADSWLPGLLLESLAAGGTDEVAFGRALALVAVYVAIAATAAAVAFVRRDVTA